MVYRQGMMFGLILFEAGAFSSGCASTAAVFASGVGTTGSDTGGRLVGLTARSLGAETLAVDGEESSAGRVVE